MATYGDTSQNPVEDLAILQGPNKQRRITRTAKSPKPSQQEAELVSPDVRKLPRRVSNDQKRKTQKRSSPEPSQQEVEWVPPDVPKRVSNNQKRKTRKTKSPEPSQQEAERVPPNVRKLPKRMSNNQRRKTQKTKSPKPSQQQVECIPPDVPKRVSNNQKRKARETKPPEPSQQEAERVPPDVRKLPKRVSNNQRRKTRKTKSPEPSQQEVEWVPPDIGKLPKRVSNLIEKVLPYFEEVEESEFYHEFMSQMETPEIVESFRKVLGNESRMQMVIYGIGSIEFNEHSRFQLGLAILMRRKFSWTPGVEVFDPVISVRESRVLESFGCRVLSVNEECRRQALTPTMLFMPHCAENLYGNLLQANWRVDMLKRIVVLGNSFLTYKEYWRLLNEIRTKNGKSDNAKAPTEYGNSTINGRQYMAAAIGFVKEFPISKASGNLRSSFSGCSWHFFSPDSESQLQLSV